MQAQNQSWHHGLAPQVYVAGIVFRSCAGGVVKRVVFQIADANLSPKPAPEKKVQPRKSNDQRAFQQRTPKSFADPRASKLSLVSKHKNSPFRVKLAQ